MNATKCNVYRDGEGNWYFAVWIDGEYNSNGSIDDADSESEAITWAEQQWPGASVRVVPAVA